MRTSRSLIGARPDSVLGQVGRQLALIGDDINRRYDTEFQNLLEQLQPTAGNAYELFTKIASRYQPITPPCEHVITWWAPWLGTMSW